MRARTSAKVTVLAWLTRPKSIDPSPPGHGADRHLQHALRPFPVRAVSFFEEAQRPPYKRKLVGVLGSRAGMILTR
jgi:hypothetical protein